MDWKEYFWIQKFSEIREFIRNFLAAPSPLGTNGTRDNLNFQQNSVIYDRNLLDSDGILMGIQWNMCIFMELDGRL